MTPVTPGTRTERLDCSRPNLSQVPPVTYVSTPEPVALGQGRMLYGHYRVTLGCGFTYLVGHTGYTGTVSSYPVDLEANPEFASLLVEQAQELAGKVLDKRGGDL